MKLRDLLLAAALGVTSAHAQTVDLPDTWAAGEKVIATVDYELPGDGAFLSIDWGPSKNLPTQAFEQSLCIWGGPGEHSLDIAMLVMKPIVIDGKNYGNAVIGNGFIRIRRQFTITGGVGPGPDPGPDPVDPVDPVNTQPFPSPGFSVLILVETSEKGRLTPQQQVIFTNSRFKNYIRAKSNKDGGYYRTMDDDWTSGQLHNVPSVIRDAYPGVVAEAAGRPWLAISNGKTKQGYSGPLPATISNMMAILVQYGGPE